MSYVLTEYLHLQECLLKILVQPKVLDFTPFVKNFYYIRFLFEFFLLKTFVRESFVTH